ncbi:RES family NAD+ phosphorylase [Hymenobacter weizhouensis]|uniref:RES family NAD+ phosphorylase n=1 Tax=Hymenobacter sp. YIM 151500-1 TaxID=2987689 RepID=UPI002226C559|nr:RES family NAD+ phosphorylase [Hymenobacter sp. YIM 151500-1]UYZ63446.1 RES family NAD+ phosphorylase [Hymenobacter sp. YIM 151500-1]
MPGSASTTQKNEDHAQQLRRQVASLRRLDLRKHSVDDLVQRVSQLLQGQALHCLEFNPGLVLYRGLTVQARPELVREVSYPPAERVQADQRANRAGVPMFYCSATWHPPFFESGVQRHDQIVICRWRTVQPLRIVSFGYADVCADDPHSDRDKALRRALQQLPPDIRQLASFLTSVFTQATSEDTAHFYRLSIAVAECCQLGTAFDGLLYPSAAMPSPAHNLALHPSCIDAGKLALEYVEHLRVNRVETETIDVCSLDFAHAPGNDDSRLQWLNRPGNWVLREGARASECRFVEGKWQLQRH